MIYKKGSTGEDVVLIQKALKEMGLFNADETGVFGDKTEAAMKVFQENNRLSPDGVVGPETWTALLSTAKNIGDGPTQWPYLITRDHLAAIAGMPTPLMADLAEWITKTCPAYEIDSPREFAHFLAQACHETDRFRTLKEYASGSAYEKRHDLGNTQLGDGIRFKGRGIFQATGRANYHQLGIVKGNSDLFLKNPELLEQPGYAVWSACEYWNARHLNDIANHPDNAVLKKKYRSRIIDVSPVEYISITINGGYNGMEERKAFYARAKEVLRIHT